MGFLLSLSLSQKDLHMKQFLILFSVGFSTTVWANSPFEAVQQASASGLQVVACHTIG